MKENTLKPRTTVYMSAEIKKMVDELYIQRFGRGKKSTLSEIFCEGIKLLHAKNVKDSLC